MCINLCKSPDLSQEHILQEPKPKDGNSKWRDFRQLRRIATLLIRTDSARFVAFVVYKPWSASNAVPTALFKVVVVDTRRGYFERLHVVLLAWDSEGYQMDVYQMDGSTHSPYYLGKLLLVASPFGSNTNKCGMLSYQQQIRTIEQQQPTLRTRNFHS